MIRILGAIFFAATIFAVPAPAHSMSIEAPSPNAMFQVQSTDVHVPAFSIPYSVTFSNAVGSSGGCTAELSSTGRTDPFRDPKAALFFQPEVVASLFGCEQRDPGGTTYTGTLHGFIPRPAGTYYLMVYRSFFDGTTSVTDATTPVPVILVDAPAPASPVPAGQVPADQVPPSIPGFMRGTSGMGFVSLGWGGSTDNVGVAGYVVFKYNGRAWVEVGRTTSTRFTYRGAPGVHSFSVAAFDAAGNQSAGRGPASARLRDTILPTAPSFIRKSQSTRSSVTLTWRTARDASGIWGYEVQIKRGQFWQGRGVARAPKTIIRGLMRNHAYAIRLRAVDNTRNKSRWVIVTARTQR